MLKIDTRYKESLTYNLSLTGTRNPATATARLIIMLDEKYSLSISGKNDGEELIFNIPKLKDFGITDKEQVRYVIELIVEDYYLIALDSEMVLLNPPEARIEKMTQLKRDIKEERKPIKIEQKQIFKPKTPFAKSFDAFVELKNKREKEKI